MQKKLKNNSCHSVFISDNTGMDTLYPEILNLLKNEQAHDNHISLLCLSTNEFFVFKEQINVLVSRFPSLLIAYFKESPKQEYLEIILNTNTKKRIKFHLSINEEWQEDITAQLLFLGIKRSEISFY